jgi:serine O-acetyltransferase
MAMQASAWEASSDARYALSSERQGQSEQVADNNENSSSTSLWHLIYQDYRRYWAAGARNAVSIIALTQGFWASCVFRVSHWTLDHCRIPVLRIIAKAGCVLCQKFIEVVTGICVPGRCNIGPGLYIGHFGNIFVDSEARIGANCNLAQGVTIGKGGRGELHGVPVLGDRVHLGANAVILGKISIGDDAVIGPGAVVMNSVPARGVAMGNPARIVGTSGSFEFVHYDGMENDPARKESLENLKAKES